MIDRGFFPFCTLKTNHKLNHEISIKNPHLQHSYYFRNHICQEPLLSFSEKTDQHFESSEIDYSYEPVRGFRLSKNQPSSKHDQDAWEGAKLLLAFHRILQLSLSAVQN